MKLPRIILSALLSSSMVCAYAHDDDDDGGDRHHRGSSSFRIDVLSSKPYLVSGGDALVRVAVKKRDVRLSDVRVELNGRNVTNSFRRDEAARTLTGLVSGMRNGSNELEVQSKRSREAELTLTNYPITGPMISGPHEFPYACTAQDFVPFAGSPALGPTDANCHVATRVQYVYRTTGN